MTAGGRGLGGGGGGAAGNANLNAKRVMLGSTSMDTLLVLAQTRDKDWKPPADEDAYNQAVRACKGGGKGSANRRNCPSG